jgi:hypothetical protein
MFSGSSIGNSQVWSRTLASKYLWWSWSHEAVRCGEESWGFWDVLSVFSLWTLALYLARVWNIFKIPKNSSAEVQELKINFPIESRAKFSSTTAHFLPLVVIWQTKVKKKIIVAGLIAPDTH